MDDHESVLLDLASRIGIDRALDILNEQRAEARKRLEDAGYLKKQRPSLRVIRGGVR